CSRCRPSSFVAAPISLGMVSSECVSQVRGVSMTFLKKLGKRAVTRLGSELSQVLGSRAGDRLGILAYHRVSPPAERAPVPTWNVTPQRFRAQLDGLLRRGYRPWPLRQVLENSREGRPIPRKTFVVTFDDGYENV